MKEVENYGKQHFPSTQNAFLFGEEQKHLISQVRFFASVNDDLGEEFDINKELWMVRNDTKHQKLIFTCKTLFKVRVKADTKQEIEREYEFSHNELWKIFGVRYGD